MTITRLLLRARAGLAAAAVFLAVLPAASAAPVAPETTLLPAGRIDPSLLREVAAGTTLAVLSWDDDAASREQVARFVRERGIGFTAFENLDMGVACVGSTGEVRDLASAPGAISVYGDHQMTPTLDRSVPTAFNGDPSAIWNVEGVTGKGVGIAILDTGIDATHPDVVIGERTLVNEQILFSSHDYQGGQGDPCPPLVVNRQDDDTETTSGHGTHLASVAAGDGSASDGKYKGMAPGADLVGYNVVDSASFDRTIHEGARFSTLRVLAAFNHLLSVGLEGNADYDYPSRHPLVKVLLMGWSGPGLHDPWSPISLMIHEADAWGFTVVMPTGNDGPAQSDCSQVETCHFNPLAIGSSVIAVGATPASSRTKLEEYSSRGDPTPRETVEGLVEYEPTLVAPGSDVTAARRLGLVSFRKLPSDHPLGANGEKSRSGTNLDYQTLTGTSVAAAHVAGAVALMQQAALDAKGCYLTPEQVREILQQTASPMAGYSEWEVGSGALDATAAVWGATFAPEVPSREPWNCPDAE